jgi:hypothetical protein
MTRTDSEENEVPVALGKDLGKQSGEDGSVAGGD